MRSPFLSPQLRLILPFVIAGFVILIFPLESNSTPTTHQIQIDARQYQYAPERIEINQGDRVEISFTSSDVVHGFYLEGYDLERRAFPGVAQSLSFTADQAGKFRYRCSVSCGPLHPFMTGEMVVRANFPFWRAIGISAVALLGAAVLFWRSIGDQHGYNQTRTTQ